MSAVMIKVRQVTVAYYTFTGDKPPADVPAEESADSVHCEWTPDGLFKSKRELQWVRRRDGSYFRYAGPVDWLTERDAPQVAIGDAVPLNRRRK